MRLILRVWCAQGLSVALSSALMTALSLHLWAQTHSAGLLSATVAVGFFTAIYLSPLAGGVVDGFSKRAIMLGSSAVAGGLSLLLALWHGVTPVGIAVLLVLLAGIGSCDALIAVGLQGMIRDLVPDDQLIRANSLVALLQNGPLVLGAPLGALLYVHGGVTGAALLNTVSYAVAGLSCLALPAIPGAAGRGSTLRLPFSGAREGLVLLFAHRGMRNAQVAYAVSNIGNGFAAGVLPALVLSGAHDGRTALSVFGLAGALGTLAGVVFFFVASARRPLHAWIVGCLLLAAVLGRLPLVFFVSVLGVVAVSAFLRSAFIEAANAPLLAIWQANVSREHQGRVFGARRLLAQGGYPLAVVGGGWLAAAIGGHDGLTVTVGVGVALEILAAGHMALSRSVATLERACEV